MKRFGNQVNIRRMYTPLPSTKENANSFSIELRKRALVPFAIFWSDSVPGQVSSCLVAQGKCFLFLRVNTILVWAGSSMTSIIQIFLGFQRLKGADQKLNIIYTQFFHQSTQIMNWTLDFKLLDFKLLDIKWTVQVISKVLWIKTD